MSPGVARPGRVYIGMSMVMPRAEELHEAIRDECRGFGLWPVRSFSLPGATTVTADVRELIVSAEHWIFELTDCPGNVRAELELALESECEPAKMLVVAGSGPPGPKPPGSGVIRQYRSLEDLRRVVHGFLCEMVGPPGQGGSGGAPGASAS